ncbi:ZIP family metal transporter [Candidatus Parcubacteria bacterium]|nr:ZIP family metal transporter [Candidatus Parcubacteria bacterium]
MLVLVAVAAFVSTILGGLFALRLADKLHLILGFSAGAVIGVAFFDLLPEALELSSNATSVATVIALGFLLYLALDRLLLLHGHGEHERGSVGAGSLSLHSLLDGVGIGLAFKVSPEVGLVVALAVLTHDFSDGINTVSYILKSGGGRTKAFRWLIIDALAPVVGILLTLFVTVSESSLGSLLALFTGFFLYIGASDLIPESHHAHPTFWTTAMTILGAAVLFGIIRLAHL